MATLSAQIRLIAGALGLALIVALTTPAGAQQPTSVNPTASSVKEDQLLRQLSIISGRGTIPDVNSYNIEQPAGREWQHFHEVTLRWISAIAILGVVAVIVIFYLTRGTVRIEGGRSGRTVERFNAVERFLHWMTAVCFIVLAISGLNITFGKQWLLPLIGAEAFTAFSQWGKYAHNFLSFPFTIGVVVIFLMWLGPNIPNSADVEWFKRGGGLVGREHVPAGRFNAGQKAIYWIQVIAGLSIAVSGYLLLFPFYATDIAGMQLAQIVHGIIAMLFVAVMLAHIYIGSLGVEGAFEAMGEGTVDVNWAKQHHSKWAVEAMGGAGSKPSKPHPMATPAE